VHETAAVHLEVLEEVRGDFDVDPLGVHPSERGGLDDRVEDVEDHETIGELHEGPIRTSSGEEPAVVSRLAERRRAGQREGGPDAHELVEQAPVAAVLQAEGCSHRLPDQRKVRRRCLGAQGGVGEGIAGLAESVEVGVRLVRVGVVGAVHRC
jgi:hypothetical protein